MSKLKSLKLVFGYQDLRTDGEDFVITPFLFAVYNNKEVYGIGFCWLFFAFVIAIRLNAPKNMKRFFKC